MGLDMYLKKQIYIGAEYEHREVKLTIEASVRGEPIKIDTSKVTYITERAGYWRKANAIHKWFVDNCQDGRDECQLSYVSREQIRELLDLCKQVQADHSLADKLLPTASGFFFGSTDYDEYYFHDIDQTIQILEAALSDDDGEYYYQSSW